MSGLLLVNLKEHNLDYNELNTMAKQLVSLALKKNFAVTFNSCGSEDRIVTDGGMRDYFHISNSFLYKNCDFLYMPDLILKLCGVDEIEKIDFYHYPRKEEIRKAFLKEYNFLNEILDIVFEFDVNLIEMIMVDANGVVLSYQDFEEIKIKRDEFLFKLFDLLRDPLNNNFNYEFPTAKILISKN